MSEVTKYNATKVRIHSLEQQLAQLRAELSIAQGMAQAATYDVQGWMNRTRKAEAEFAQLRADFDAIKKWYDCKRWHWLHEDGKYILWIDGKMFGVISEGTARWMNERTNERTGEE